MKFNYCCGGLKNSSRIAVDFSRDDADTTDNMSMYDVEFVSARPPHPPPPLSPAPVCCIPWVSVGTLLLAFEHGGILLDLWRRIGGFILIAAGVLYVMLVSLGSAISPVCLGRQPGFWRRRCLFSVGDTLFRPLFLLVSLTPLPPGLHWDVHAPLRCFG